MDELLSIGQGDGRVRKRGLRGLNLGTPTVKRGLVEEIRDEIPPAPAADSDRHQQHVHAPPRAATHLSPRSICALCHEAIATFTCPSCHAPYCSLACYRSPRHAACSQPFSQRGLRDELGDGAGRVDEEERKKMMDVLRRLHNLDANDHSRKGEEQVAEEEEEEEEDERDEQIGPDELDEATPDQLLALLSHDEKARFEAAIKDEDPTQARAKALLDGIARGEKEGTGASAPWWNTFEGIATDQAFVRELEKLAISLKGHASLPFVEFNIVATLLAYAYMLRHLDLSNFASAIPVGIHQEPTSVLPTFPDLKGVRSNDTSEYDDMPGLEPDVERGKAAETHKPLEPSSNIQEEKVARELFDRLAPFVNASPTHTSSKGTGSRPRVAQQEQDSSRVLLSSVEDASLYFLARIGPTQGRLASTMVLLLQDVLFLLDAPKVAETRTSNRLTSSFSDLSGLLSGHGRRKITFFGAVWRNLEGDRISRVREQLSKESQKFSEELQRAEDEERWKAAEEATSAGGVVLTETSL